MGRFWEAAGAIRGRGRLPASYAATWPSRRPVWKFKGVLESPIGIAGGFVAQSRRFDVIMAVGPAIAAE